MEAATIQRAETARRHDEPATNERAVSGWKPADPGPLGLAAFAMTTFVLSMFNSNLVNGKGVPVVLGLALAYGGIVQLLAGMWEFRNGNMFGAVAFSSFGAFWISFWALEAFYAKDITGNAGHAVGLYLWGWAIFTAYMTVAAMRTSAAVAARVRLAYGDVRAAGDRRVGRARNGHPLGRLCGPGDRSGRLVRVVRGRRELDVRAHRRACHSALARQPRRGAPDRIDGPALAGAPMPDAPVREWPPRQSICDLE